MLGALLIHPVCWGTWSASQMGRRDDRTAREASPSPDTNAHSHTSVHGSAWASGVLVL